jgi:hypothetical protein
MVSARPAWWSLASIAAPFFIAFCAACSAESPSGDAMMNSVGAAGPIGGGAGASGGAAGQSGSAGSAGSNRAGTGGSSGSAGSPVGTGGASGIAGQAGSAGASGNGGGGAGTGGQAGQGGSAGAAGAAGSEAGAGGMSSAGCEVAPITDEMRDQYDNMNDPYYEKFASANGVIVGTGSGVDDEAIIRYCRLLVEMTSNEDVREAILADNMWFTMIADDEQLSSLPQINRTYGTSLNRRARGLGGLTPTICAEDSIMCMPGDPWDGDCICPHETGHTLWSSGVARVSGLSSRFTEITNAIRSSGRLANAYIWMDGNQSGMMAWGVQAWYDCAIDGSNGAYHSDINTRAELQQELPDLYEILSEILPEDNEYVDCYANP